MKSLKSYTFLIVLLLFPFLSFSQNCNHEVFAFEELRPDFSLIYESNEGGYLVAFNSGSTSSTPTNIKLNKLDSNFNLEWEIEFGDERNQNISAITQDNQNNYYILGTDKRFTDNHIILTKINPQGNQIFLKTLDNSELGLSGSFTDYSIGEDIIFDNNQLVVLGSVTKLAFNPDGSFDDAYAPLLIKYDLEGNIIDAKSTVIDVTAYDSDIFDLGHQLPKRIIKHEDTYWVTGTVDIDRLSLSGQNLCFVASYDENLNLLSDFHIGEISFCFGLNYGADLAVHPNGFLYLLGLGKHFCIDASGADFIVKMTQNGEIEWRRTITGRDHTSMHILDDGNLILTSPASINKYNQDGRLCWTKTISGNFNTGTKHRLIELESKELIAIGDNNNGIEVYRTDSLGNHCTNLVHGVIFYDENQNCIKDESEVGMSNIRLSIVRNPSISNSGGTETGSDGYFSHLIDTSLANIFIQTPNEFFDIECGFTDSLGIKFEDFQNKTDFLEIPFWTDVDCSNVHVRNQSAFNRICMEGTNRINLENTSAFPEQNVELRLTFPDEIMFTGSTSPHTVMGNIVTFNLPTIRYGSGTSITFTTLIDCDAEIGQIGTVTYEIFPSNPCDTDNPVIEGELNYLFGNSWDPNDINGRVDGENTCYDESTNTELIEYLVRFENVGNDFAFNVVVRDTINTSQFDINTLCMKKASAEYEYALEEDSILVITFRDINLGFEGLSNFPDVARGFVVFEIESFINQLDVVENRAGIFFDNNDPIITNLSSINYCLADADEDGFTSDVDCDDFNENIYPGATELCDGFDNDCNGEIDDNLTMFILYPDLDEDGYGDENESIEGCASEVEGYLSIAGDCDDTNPNINPDAIEFCDDIDNNCNGEIDENLTMFTLYRDLDGDGFGNEFIVREGCESEIDGFANNSEDCDDTDSSINPDAMEICDNIDNNCDGEVDDNLTVFTLYQDLDEDGYGNENELIEGCESEIEGYVNVAGDCDDTNSNINPDAMETCDNIDNNCNGDIDDNLTLFTLYQDLDKDGYGNENEAIEGCASEIDGYVNNAEDCDDTNALINPLAEEIPNNEIDEDCDGMDLITSVHSLEDAGITIYPNPFKDDLQIRLTRPFNFSVKIISTHGQIILQTNNEKEINLERLGSGVYLIQIENLDTRERCVDLISKL